MASFRKRGKVWRVEVFVNGVRKSATRPTKGEASAWAVRQEAELAGERLPDKTLAHALQRYSDEVSPDHKGERWERVRLKAMARTWALAKLPLHMIAAPDIAERRDARLRKVAPASVLREMNLLRSVLEVARRDWHWIHENPMRDVRRPTAPPARRRRVTDAEIAAMVAALYYRYDMPPVTANQRVAAAFLFALETAMRAGEILGLRGRDVGPHSVILPDTKNGDRREVPLSTAAGTILAVLPAAPDALVFDLKPGTRDALWRKGRDRAVKAAAPDLAQSLATLHFHDSRAQAIWRLSKKLDVLELARMIGHRDPRSLLLYYSSTAKELAAKLG